MQQEHESQGSPHVAAEQAAGHRGPTPRAQEALAATSFDRGLQIELIKNNYIQRNILCISCLHKRKVDGRFI